MTEPRPASAAEAVQRALRIVNVGGSYQLGAGDHAPRVISGRCIDVPWTDNGDTIGSDCAGFALSWCYKLKRHRVGYNNGPWASVSDDINCNSAIEDAAHARELFAPVDGDPQPGDLIAYPTFRINELTFIGHVAIVTGVTRWRTGGTWDLLEVAQCKGPNGRAPGVVATDGSVFAHHDVTWPKDEHRCRLLRAVP